MGAPLGGAGRLSRHGNLSGMDSDVACRPPRGVEAAPRTRAASEPRGHKHRLACGFCSSSRVDKPHWAGCQDLARSRALRDADICLPLGLWISRKGGWWSTIYLSIYLSISIVATSEARKADTGLSLPLRCWDGLCGACRKRS